MFNNLWSITLHHHLPRAHQTSWHEVWWFHFPLHYKRKQTDRFSVDTINSNRSSLEVSLCYKLFILVRDQWLEHLKQISKTLKLKSFKAIRILIKSQRILTLSIVKKGRFYFTLILVKSSFLFHWMYLCNIKKLDFQSDGMNRWFSILYNFQI